MSNEVQVHNTIFRDTMVGVLFFIAAIALLVVANAATGSLHSLLITLNIALNGGGLFFLLKAFKKDKYRLEAL